MTASGGLREGGVGSFGCEGDREVRVLFLYLQLVSWRIGDGDAGDGRWQGGRCRSGIGTMWKWIIGIAISETEQERGCCQMRVTTAGTMPSQQGNQLVLRHRYVLNPKS